MFHVISAMNVATELKRLHSEANSVTIFGSLLKSLTTNLASIIMENRKKTFNIEFKSQKFSKPGLIRQSKFYSFVGLPLYLTSQMES